MLKHFRDSNVGKPGVWVYLIGDRRRYGRFRIVTPGSTDDINDSSEEFQRESQIRLLNNKIAPNR